MRRQKYRAKKEKSKNKSKIFVYAILTFVLILIIAVVYFFVTLPQLEKFVFVNEKENGDAELILIANEVTKYTIPADTVLEASRGYGQYKLGSLWILSAKEGLSGDLVVETIRKNYLVPVYLWKRQDETNLSLKQQLKIKMLDGLNASSVQSLSTLELSNSVLVNFVDNELQESGTMVDLVDLTGDPSVSNSVSSILGTMGTKIAGYSKGYDKEIDCQIGKTKELQLSYKFSKLFNCELLDLDGEENTVKIILGAKFAERF